MKDYYKHNKPLLFLAVVNSFTNVNSKVFLDEWEYDSMKEIEQAYSKEIKIAKDMIVRSKKYNQLGINEKAEIASFITEYLYNQRLEEKDKGIEFRYLI